MGGAEKEYFLAARVIVVSAELSYRVGQKLWGRPRVSRDWRPIFFRARLFALGVRPTAGEAVGRKRPIPRGFVSSWPRDCPLRLGLFATAFVFINVLL
jgi:hypothetical protein